jgi:energy-coupling factor transporter ATP-binding protein EcfA2
VTDDLRVRLQGWMRALTLDPLDPTDPAEDRYVPLEEAGKGAVDGIHATIALSLETTSQLLSGPRGSGKTTELNRLRGALEKDGYTVAIVDILQFVNQSTPVDVADFLIAMALGVSEKLPPSVIEEQGFARRFVNFLRRINVSIEAGPVSMKASEEEVKLKGFGVNLEVDLKRDLKGSQTFVTELRSKLASQLPSLQAEIADFFQDLVSQNRTVNPETSGVVIIVDSLEKLRGTLENDEQVQASVEGLFVQHSDKLRFRSHHTIYTVPTYLLFTAPGALPYSGPVQPVPIPQLRNQKGEVDANAEQTLKELTEVIARRIPWQELLGEDSALHNVIGASGGHLRDLFRILQQIINSVFGRGLDMPVSPADISEALNKVAHGFANVTKEQGDFLRRVNDEAGIVEPAADEVQLMARLMDTHMILQHTNGRDWYEVHPLARRVLGLK